MTDFSPYERINQGYRQVQFKELQLQYNKLVHKLGRIQHWYETADRSPHSWAELDRIMNDD